MEEKKAPPYSAVKIFTPGMRPPNPDPLYRKKIEEDKIRIKEVIKEASRPKGPEEKEVTSSSPYKK